MRGVRSGNMSDPTGAADQAVYRRRALLHIHGSGQSIGLQQNLAAWVLASPWRGMTLYPLHGPVAIAGRSQDGEWRHWTMTLRSTSALLRRASGRR